MADADWHRYKQLRGRELPATFELGDVRYSRVKLLKRDFYAAVGIYDRVGEHDTMPAQVLLKIYHTDSLWGFPLGWLGRWLARRECQCHLALAGVAGVPQLLARHGESGLVREFVPGCNLKEYRRLKRPGLRFYPELARILAAVHARGLSHNDLAKPENVLVTEDGRPVLIDFQIALGARRPRLPLVGWLVRWFIRYMQGVDRYHLRKHHTHDRPEDYSPEELHKARRKGPLLVLHGTLVRRPYRAVRHFVLRRWLLDDQQRRAA